LIATIAIGFGLALILGLGVSYFKMPPLVGYLLAGIVIGPGTPGFVADLALAGQLAEIGVMLLMFGVGLHFSLNDLLKVKNIAIPGAIVQIVVATLLGMLTAFTWGWNLGAALVFGLCLSVASTVVLLRAMESKGILDSLHGKIAVGWLIVEDLLMVLVLVLLPAMTGVLKHTQATIDVAQISFALLTTLGKVAAFVGSMWFVGRYVFPKLLWWVARTGSRELFTLCVIATAIGVAFGAAKLFDVSFALGAFFAGTMLRESEFSHRAADESLPLRDAFAVLFFVSVGMLFDINVILEQPLRLLAAVGIVMLAKTFAAVVLVLMFRYSLQTALTVGTSLAQIGEFSFILASLGVGLGLMPAQGQSLVLATALISIAANSVLFNAVEPVRSWLSRHFKLVRCFSNYDPEPDFGLLSGELAHINQHVVLVGHGRVGARILKELRAQDLPLVVIEQNRQTVQRLQDNGVLAIAGRASDFGVLNHAQIARASLLLIVISDAVSIQKVVKDAKQANPNIHIVACTPYHEDARFLEQNDVSRVFFGEAELAGSMAAHAIDIMNRHPKNQPTLALNLNTSIDLVEIKKNNT
jgi:CPA2 family monovalent cation:H+ antiporter-2